MAASNPPPPETLLQHTEFVRAVARAALGGDALVDDVVQETWLAALQGGTTQARELRPWLGSVAWRRAKDLLRRRARQQRGDRQVARADYSPPTSDAVVRAETGRRVVAAVLALDEPYRTAVLLRYQDGLPPREIAYRTGVPVETARTHVKRGIAKLRRLLDEDAHRRGESASLLLLPLLDAPRTSTLSLAATGIAGGLVVKKVFAVVLVLTLLLATGVAVDHFVMESPQPAAPPENHGTSDAPVQSPSLAGRPVASAQEPAPEPSPPLDSMPESGTVRGVVVDPDGHPLAGVSVRLDPHPPWHASSAPGSASSPETADAATSTGDDGRFTISVPGKASWVYLRASAPGWAMASEQGSSVGKDHEARIVMTPAARMQVVVLDDRTGRPLEGAEVQALNGISAQAYLVYPPWPAAFGVTDEGGRAALFVPPGPMRLLAWSAGYARVQRDTMTEAGSDASVEIRLLPGGTVRGTVLDERGAPVSGATVHAFAPSAWQHETTTAGDGSFLLENTPPALAGEPDVVQRKSVVILVQADGHPQAWVDTPAPSSGEERILRVQLEESRTVRGVVRTADGSPVRATRIDLVLKTPSYRNAYASTPSASAGLDEHGRFAFTDMPPGPLKLRIGDSRDPECEVEVNVPRDEDPTPVDIVLGTDVDLSIRVVDATGSGVPDVLVYAVTKSADHIIPYPYQPGSGTDADGVFRLPHQPRVPTFLVVDARDHAPVVRELSPQTMGQDEIRVQLPTGTIKGRAVHPDGRPARVGLRIRQFVPLQRAAASVVSRTTRVEPDADGRFVFTGVGEGKFSVQVDDPSIRLLSFISQAWQAGEENASILVATPEEAAHLYVEAEVLDAHSGEPVTEPLQVEMHPDGGAGWGLMPPVSSVAGLYRSSEPYPPGEHVVRVSGKGWRSTDANVSLVWGEGVPRVRILLERQ